MCDRFPEKGEHAYANLAENAAELHRWAAPTCPGVEAYACSDHFHVGHVSPHAGAACKAAHPRRDRFGPR